MRLRQRLIAGAAMMLTTVVMLLNLLPACAQVIEGQLFITNDLLTHGTIERLNADGTERKVLVTTGGGGRGIALDLAAGKLYWTDAYRHVISKANLDGTQQEDIGTRVLKFPFGLAIDVKGEKLYWSDPGWGPNLLGRANLDGTDLTIAIACASRVGLPCSVRDVALDLVHGKRYWTIAFSLNAVLGDILRSDLDGSNIETVVAAMGSPAWLRVDPIGQKIYWTDYVYDVVRRANLDGSNIEDLYVVGKNANPDALALDLKNGYIYWSQEIDNLSDQSCIKRMHLDGTSPEDVLCGLGLVAGMEFAALDCTTATASVNFPRLGNRHRYPVTIQGVTAPDGGPVALAINSIFQDEPVTNPTGKTCPDGVGIGTAVAKVRNERLLAGDGRVYHIGFTATDSEGASCTGEVKVCVPVNEGEACGDQGALFDSTVCPE